MTRICPERDGPCPHGFNCPHVKDRYSCKPGWKSVWAVTDPVSWDEIDALKEGHPDA